MKYFSQKKSTKIAICLGLILTLCIAVLFTWMFYRHYDHLRAVAGVDHFVWQYIQSLKNGTDFYRKHSCDTYSCGGFQADNAKEVFPRYKLPYTMESKAISGGPYWLYNTAFQIVLRFDNAKRLYLHIRYLGGDYQVGVVPWSDQPTSPQWSDGRDG